MDNNQNYNVRSPFDEYYDFFPSLEDEKKARKTFSRLSLSVFVFLLISSVAMYAILFVVEFILINTAPGLINLLLNDPSFNFILSYVSMYCIALPVLVLIVRKMEVYKPQKRKMSFIEFIVVYCIATAVMFLGNIIGQLLNSVISSLIKKEITNGVEDMIFETPMWLIVLVVVFIGPIVEELIFRKLMIDRLSKYGDVLAITFSSVAFGLFHGNFYQFFYATAVGFVLGYVYTKTRSMKLSALLHMIINFFGSVVALFITKLNEEYTVLFERFQAGEELATAEEAKLSLYSMIISGYSLFDLLVVAAGVVLLIVVFSKRMIKLQNRGLVRLDEHQAVKLSVVNVGSILFLILSIALFVISIIV